jgi:copper homeostasis protein
MCKPRPILLEVAVASVDGANVAQENGADRVELNSAIELGGLTPSHGLLHETLRSAALPIVVMLRPRAGGFVYSAAEFTTMQRDAEHALSQGAGGIAFGFLTSEGRIDLDRTRQLLREADPAQIVFHRAFDSLPDPIQALDQLVDLGVTRVLTSGGRPTALEGAATISQLIEHARGRIEILPGAGIRAQNVVELVRRTGCDQVHGSFSTLDSQDCRLIQPVAFPVTDAQQIRAMRAALDNDLRPGP